MLPPRPNKTCREVKHFIAASVMNDVRDWLEKNIGIDGEMTPELKALVMVALQETDDPYHTGGYVNAFYDWNTDFTLVEIFSKAFKKSPEAVTQLTREWVIANGVRLNVSNGDTVDFSIGDATAKGEVVACIPKEARMVVAHGRIEPTYFNVNIEDVTKITRKEESK